MNTEPAKIHVIADQPICRYGISRLLESTGEMQVSTESPGVQDALIALDRSRSDVIVLDLATQPATGIETIKFLHGKFPEIPIVAISTREEAVYVPRVLRAGARAYLLKRESLDHFLAALRKVLRGEVYISPMFSNQILTRLARGTESPTQAALERLSDREMEILHLLGTAHTTRQVAAKLGLSIKTVESHRARLKEKLGLRNAVELIRFAVEWVQQRTE